MNYQITDLFVLTIGSFVPFVNLLVLIGTGFPSELTVLITMVLVILSSIQVFLLAMFVFQTVHNILWNPDV